MSNLPENVSAVIATLGVSPRPIGFTDGHLLSLPGERAFDAWKGLADACRGNGWWPVILGDRSDVEDVEEMHEANADATLASTLTYASTLDLAKHYRSRSELDDAIANSVEEGEWPEGADVQRQAAPVAVTHLESGQPLRSCTIALLPVAHSWQVPAAVRFGAFNECPEPAVHVAQQKLWHERFGSEICAISASTIECVCLRPPETRDDAMALANEQFRYCFDIVAQGTETISNLAAALQHGTMWFFWWD